MANSQSPYKAIMLDIDGTLVIHDWEALPSERVTKSVHQARKKGIHVALATGRPFHATKKIIEQLGLTGPSVLSDGSRIYDVKSGEVLLEQTIDLSSVNKILNLLKDYHPKVYIVDDNREYTWEDEYTPYKPLNIFVEKLTSSEREEFKQKLSEIPNIVFHEYKSYESGPGILISHSMATKQHGILEVAKLLGIETHEIIGVGDGYNDFPMMMACGLRVAMGNAVPELKKIADYVAPSVIEDGVAEVIERYILNS